MIYRPTRVHKEDPEYYTTSFPPMKYAIDRLRDVSGCTPHLHNPELTFRNGTAGNRTRCVPLASAKTILFKHFISLFIPLLRSILPPEVYTSGWYIYIYIYLGEMLMTCTPKKKKNTYQTRWWRVRCAGSQVSLVQSSWMLGQLYLLPL